MSKRVITAVIPVTPTTPAELLPCPYFHTVFTLPHELNPLIIVNKRVMLALLFTAVKETLQVFARDPQWRIEGQLGFISVLHTWNQKLMDHFHLHVLPRGFTKIRYFGFLAHTNKSICIPLIRALIDTTTAFAQKLVESVQEMMLRLIGVDIGCCPKCGQGKMVIGEPIARAVFDTS